MGQDATVRVKISFEAEMRRFSCAASFGALADAARKCFGLASIEGFAFQYIDRDQDTITVGYSEELLEAIREMVTGADDTLRLAIVPARTSARGEVWIQDLASTNGTKLIGEWLDWHYPALPTPDSFPRSVFDCDAPVFIPGAVTVLAANAGESVPGARGGGGEGGQFITYAEPDGEESRMQPILDEEDDENAGDYGDENREYVGDDKEDPDYAAQGDEDSWTEAAAPVLGQGDLMQLSVEQGIALRSPNKFSADQLCALSLMNEGGSYVACARVSYGTNEEQEELQEEAAPAEGENASDCVVEAGKEKEAQDGKALEKAALAALGLDASDDSDSGPGMMGEGVFEEEEEDEHLAKVGAKSRVCVNERKALIDWHYPALPTPDSFPRNMFDCVRAPEFIPGAGTVLAANTGESVPGARGGGGGGGGVRELPGYHFIPYAEPDGEESRMQPMYEEGDYGYDYASQGDEDSRPEVAATVLGDGTSDDAVTYADLDPGEEQVLREFKAMTRIEATEFAVDILRGTGWQLELAVHAYMDMGDSGGEPMVASPRVPQASPVPSILSRTDTPRRSSLHVCGCKACSFRVERPEKECKFGSRCPRRNCPFAHPPSIAPDIGSARRRPTSTSNRRRNNCREGIKCRDQACLYAHPSPALKCCESDPPAPAWPPAEGTRLTARYNQSSRWRDATVVRVDKGTLVFVQFDFYRDTREISIENVRNVYFKRHDKGGIQLHVQLPHAPTHITQGILQTILSQYKIHHAEITLREDITVDELIDLVAAKATRPEKTSQGPDPVGDYDDDDDETYQCLIHLCRPLSDPVLAQDGRVYCRSCIEKWFRQCREDRRPPTSPLTNLEIGQKLVPRPRRARERVHVDIPSNCDAEVWRQLEDDSQLRLHLERKYGVTIRLSSSSPAAGARQSLALSIDSSVEAKDALDVAKVDLEIFLQEPMRLIEDLQKARESECYVYIDYSNIAAGGSLRSVSSKQLNDLVVGSRQARDRVLVGSCVGGEERLEDWKELGYQVFMQHRDAAAREQFVDDALVAQMQRALLRSKDENNSGKTLVLLSGDGNSNEGRASFSEVVKEALFDHGWRVEVWCWKASCSTTYRELQGMEGCNFSLFYLDACLKRRA